MKKTLLVTIDFPPMFGGVANYWGNLVKHFSPNDLMVLAPEYKDSISYDTKQEQVICRRRLFSDSVWLWPKWLPLVVETFKICRREGIEKIIVAHALPTGYTAWLVKFFLGIPYVISAHGLDIALAARNSRKRKLLEFIVRGAESIIVNSEFTKGLMMAVTGADVNKIKVIFPCPNVVYQKVSADKLNTIKNKYNLHGKKIVLTVSRLIERKGQDKVIMALPEVIKEIPEVVYLIVGRGPQLNTLKSLVHSLRLTDKVVFFEDILNDELPMFYTLQDVFIMPTRELADGDIEGFGIVYLEANAFGKPVIAGRSGGAVEAVIHGVNGLIVDPLDVRAIGLALIDLFRDERKAKELGLNGGKRINEKFNWAQQAGELKKVLL